MQAVEENTAQAIEKNTAYALEQNTAQIPEDMWIPIYNYLYQKFI